MKCNFVGLGNVGCSGSYCYSWIPHDYSTKQLAFTSIEIVETPGWFEVERGGFLGGQFFGVSRFFGEESLQSQSLGWFSFG